MNPQQHFGPIDIYLFDQILKGRIAPGMRIVDAGCGSGRNLVYFVNEGYDVHAVDSERQVDLNLPPGGFRQERIENNSFPDAFADVVIVNAVLHFASGEDHFNAMLHGAWRILKPGGLFFCRLASSIGMEDRVMPLEGRRFLLPDGSQRYLVDERTLLGLTIQLGGILADPLKTTIVQDQRAMTTWVIRKNSDSWPIAS